MGLEPVILLVWVCSAATAIIILVRKVWARHWIAAAALIMAILVVVGAHSIARGPDVWSHYAYLALVAALFCAMAVWLRPKWLVAIAGLLAFAATYVINLAPNIGVLSEFSLLLAPLWLILSTAFLADAVTQNRRKGTS